MPAEVGRVRKFGKEPVSLTGCPQARHHEFQFYGNTTSLDSLRVAVRDHGDVQLWLRHFPWCLFYLTGPYCSDIHPFSSIAEAKTVHELGVALLESIYSCLLQPYREVGGRLEGNAGERPDWFRPRDPETSWWSCMTIPQKEAVLLLSSPPVVLYPSPHVHGVSHAANTHHDCCLRLRAVGHCGRWVLGEKPYFPVQLLSAQPHD